MSPEEKRKAYMKDYRKNYANLRVDLTVTPEEYAVFEHIANREGV